LKELRALKEWTNADLAASLADAASPHVGGCGSRSEPATGASSPPERSMRLLAADEIVGRASELAAADRLAAGLAAGAGGLIWVQGEPGIGKTALVNAALARASALGCRVLQATGDELMAPFPLRLMADCLGISPRSADPSSAQIASLLRGEPADTGGMDLVIAAAERMLEFVGRLCADGPVALALEDLHWADEPSLLAWSRLARTVTEIPLLLIGSARPQPGRAKLDLLRDLVVRQGGVALDLGPLGPDSVTALGARIIGGTPGPRLRAALGRAAGNPLYARELAAALAADGLVEARGGAAELRGDIQVTPLSVTMAISGRLGFLPGAAREALAIAALLGSEFGADELAVATGCTLPQVADVVKLAVATGVLSDGAERLQFTSGLIHQALVEQTPPAMRPATQADIARLLATAGRSLGAVARLLLAVPAGTGEWVLDWLASLPETELYAQPEASAELLTREIDSIPDDDHRWEALAVRLACVLFWLGCDERAGEVAAAVARRTADPVVAARMRVQMIRSAGRTGRVADGLQAAGPLPGDELLPAGWQARLAAWSASLASSDGQAARGAALAARALEQAAESGDQLAIGHARHALAMCGPDHERAGHIAAGLHAVTGRDPESRDLRLLLLASYVAELTRQARQEEAASALSEALALAGRAGGRQAAAISAIAAEFCYTYGRWDEALNHLASMGDEPGGAAQPSGAWQPGGASQPVGVHGLAALILLHRGDRQGADSHLLRAGYATWRGQPTKPAQFPPLFPVTQALAVRAEADGDPAGAVRLMSRWLGTAHGPGDRGRDTDLPLLIRLALAAGDTATALRAAAIAQEDLTGGRSPDRIAAARCCQALIAEDAEGLLDVAADYHGHGWLLKSSFALEEAAVRLAAAGQTGRARAALSDAARTLTLLGASWDIRRADARLRPYGVRRGPRSRPRHATTGWRSLTPSEERIAGLVAEGLSNPDIAAKLYLSRRTVEAHVSNILAKLRVNSRAGIVRAAMEAANGCGAAKDAKVAV
jgi:DNA-binding NarL/FixJ family response regulator